MPENLLEVGVGAIVAIMVIKEVLPHLRRNGNSNDVQGCALSKICEMRHDTLKVLIRTVNENISAQTRILTELCKEIVKIKERLP